MVPPQSGYSSAEIWIELEFGNVGFLRRGKTGVPGGKPQSRSREENHYNKLNPRIASRPGIDPEPHRWKLSALATAPSLLPKYLIVKACLFLWTICVV